MNIVCFEIKTYSFLVNFELNALYWSQYEKNLVVGIRFQSTVCSNLLYSYAIFALISSRHYFDETRTMGVKTYYVYDSRTWKLIIHLVVFSNVR